MLNSFFLSNINIFEFDIKTCETKRVEACKGHYGVNVCPVMWGECMSCIVGCLYECIVGNISSVYVVVDGSVHSI